jgi:simple sugar transport system substrate-binding protein
MRKVVLTLLTIAAIASMAACSNSAASAPTSVAVFVPGVVSGSPTYEQLVAGVTKAVAATKGATMKVIEAGFNQSEWQDRLTAVAASGQFSLIVSSNPSLPELCAKVAVDFPKIRFFVADAWMPGNPAIHTVLYNQYEQAWTVGYLAGLVASTPIDGHKPSGMAAMVVAQRYPSLDKLIEPGFRAGLVAAFPGARYESRVIGNWYDANKASELAKSLFASGADIVLPIAGGAGQGVLSAAAETGRRALWFDGSGYDLAPGVVVGSAIVRQDRLVAERVGQILSGKGAALYGKADIVNAAQGYVDFDETGAAYKALPASLRAAFEKELEALRKGTISFPVTGL